MRACVVLFPGSNAEREMIRTLRHVCGVTTEVVWHTETSLPVGVDLVAIPGGFSYGDYLRCGAIAKGSPIMAAIRKHGERGGYVLGVCNGFQILTEVGMLPGALTRNSHRRFECKDCYVITAGQGAFTPQSGIVWKLPIAHAEGRYQVSSSLRKKMQEEGQIALRYCTESGTIEEGANPNGSVDAIAGVYGGPAKNILGLMPHPERMSEPILGCSDGHQLFANLISTLRGGN